MKTASENSASWIPRMVTQVLSGGLQESIANRHLDSLLNWLSERDSPSVELISREFLKRGKQLPEARQLALRVLDRYLFKDSHIDTIAVLGLKSGATDEQVRQRYRRLIHVYHPDRNTQDNRWVAKRAEQLNRVYDRFKREGLNRVPPAKVRTQKPVRTETATKVRTVEAKHRAPSSARRYFGSADKVQKRILGGMIIFAFLFVGMMIISYQNEENLTSDQELQAQSVGAGKDVEENQYEDENISPASLVDSAPEILNVTKPEPVIDFARQSEVDEKIRESVSTEVAYDEHSAQKPDEREVVKTITEKAIEVRPTDDSTNESQSSSTVIASAGVETEEVGSSEDQPNESEPGLVEGDQSAPESSPKPSLENQQVNTDQQEKSLPKPVESSADSSDEKSEVEIARPEKKQTGQTSGYEKAIAVRAIKTFIKGIQKKKVDQLGLVLTDPLTINGTRYSKQTALSRLQSTLEATKYVDYTVRQMRIRRIDEVRIWVTGNLDLAYEYELKDDISYRGPVTFKLIKTSLGAFIYSMEPYPL